MKLSGFYVFDDTFSRTPVSITNDDLDWKSCCRVVRGDYSGVSFPIVFKQISGRKWTDVLSPASVSLHVVSNAFLELLTQQKVTGWKSYSVKIYDKLGNEVEGYSGLSIVGRCGKIDKTKSIIIKKQSVPDGPFSEYYVGMYFDSSEWDGSDMFIPEDTLFVVVSQRVRQLCIDHKITNVAFENIADIELYK